MTSRRELLAFAATLAILLTGFFGDSLLGGKVLSPADVLLVSASFRDVTADAGYEPANRLLMDPVLQFQPWLEFNRRDDPAGPAAALERPGRVRGAAPGQRPERGLRPVPRDRLPRHAPRGPRLDGRRAALGRRAGDVPAGAVAGAWGPGDAGSRAWRSRSAASWSSGCSSRSRAWRSGCPGCFWASDRVLDRPGPRTVGLAGAGRRRWSCWAGTSRPVPTCCSRRPRTWPGGSAGAGAGGVGAERGRAARRGRWGRAWALPWRASRSIPLAVYLAQEPGLGRSRPRAGRRPGRWTRPRLLDAVCTALPYAFGSQRRGHPNLAQGRRGPQPERVGGRVRRAGDPGLARAPGWSGAAAAAAGRVPRRPGGSFGALGAFGFPPVDNLLRALPVLNVTDNRRLTLWVAFGAGAAGRDRARPAGRRGRERRRAGAWLGRSAWPPGSCWWLWRSASAASSRGSARRAVEHYAEAAARHSGGRSGGLPRPRPSGRSAQTLDLPAALPGAGRRRTCSAWSRWPRSWRRGRVGAGAASGRRCSV